MKKTALWLIATAIASAASLSHAVTLRVANQGDVGSMDPHSLNESLQLSFMGESRRLDNTRLKRELRVRLRHPTVETGLRSAS